MIDRNGTTPEAETLVLGLYEMNWKGRKIPRTELLRNMGKLLPDIEKDFMKIAKNLGGGKEGVSAASSFLVSEVLEGKYGIGKVIFDLEGISPDKLTGKGKLLQYATNSELAVVLGKINEGPISTTDIIFKHAGGTSIIKKGSQVVEGAQLPKMLLDKISNPGLRHKPTTPSGGSSSAPKKAPKAPKAPKIKAGIFTIVIAIGVFAYTGDAYAAAQTANPLAESTDAHFRNEGTAGRLKATFLDVLNIATFGLGPLAIEGEIERAKRENERMEQGTYTHSPAREMHRLGAPWM